VTPTGYRAYQKVQVETASPYKWIPMLFREACISTEMAIEAIGRKDYPLANERLIKAQEILMELMGALDLRVEIAQNLHQLYAYIHGLLVEGNVKKDTVVLGQALGMLKELYETWSAAERSVQAGAATAGGGVSVAR